MNSPNVKIISEENNTLKFTLSNTHYSLANSLRRIILSDIPSVVFRTFPHEDSKVNITINTTRLNNEILKQRIGCIPIHITDVDFPYKEYSIEIDEKNDTDTIKMCTTEHIKMKNIVTDKYLSSTAVKEIFPPDLITNDYIPITRLRPKLSENLEGEQLQLNATFDIGTAKEDGMYNVASTCCYGNTVDEVKANDIWNDKQIELEKNGMEKQDVSLEKANWEALDKKRIFLENSFDFTIETVGVFSNFSLVFKSCDVMIVKCKNFNNLLEGGKINIEKNEDSTTNNEYIITLENEDYTLGNALVHFLYEIYFKKQNDVSFVGFRVPHPHIPNGIIRIAFNSAVEDNSTVIQCLLNASNNVIETFTNIQSNFKE